LTVGKGVVTGKGLVKVKNGKIDQEVKGDEQHAKGDPFDLLLLNGRCLSPITENNNANPQQNISKGNEGMEGKGPIAHRQDGVWQKNIANL
jgi:hypothetical protein